MKTGYRYERLIIRIKYQVWYVEITKITDERGNLKEKHEIRIPYDCILRLT